MSIVSKSRPITTGFSTQFPDKNFRLLFKLADFICGVNLKSQISNRLTRLSCGASKLNAETGSPARPTIIVEKLTVKLDAQQLSAFKLI